MEKLGVGGQKQQTIYPNSDMWKRYRGENVEPSHNEMLTIGPFMRKFDFEEDDFDEDSEEWRSMEKVLHITIMRQQLITFLHKVRESKGYDVEYDVEYAPAYFCNSPFIPTIMYEGKYCNSPFIPTIMYEGKYFYDQVMKAAKLAISEINAETIVSGKCYEFVGVEKVVWTLNRMFLLTICAEEFNVNGEDIIMMDADADVVLKTIRAMVFNAPKIFELMEWSFKKPASTA